MNGKAAGEGGKANETGSRADEAKPCAAKENGHGSFADGTPTYGRTWSRGRVAAPEVPCLRVAQWNILADSLARGSEHDHEPYDSPGAGDLPGQRWIGWGEDGPPDDYQRPHIFRCSPQWLAWEARGPRITSEIKRLNADVIALQEVDKWEYLQQQLVEYDGVFAAKTGFDDGVALLWRKPLIPGAGKVLRFSRGAQVALLQRLLVPEEGTSKVRALVVASMHLKAGFTERYEATREDQLERITAAISSFAAGDPVIILADLNAHPTDLSGMVAQAIPLAKKKGYHSAYSKDGFTVWSGWTDGEVRAAFDHILYSPNGLECHSVYELPHPSTVGGEPCRLPNYRWPSDHLSLSADFLILSALRPPSRRGDSHKEFDSQVLEVANHNGFRSRATATTTTNSSGLPVCRFYANGGCHYAHLCKYPHSDGRRAERCYFYDTGQQCRHGDSCHFLHSSIGSKSPLM